MYSQQNRKGSIMSNASECPRTNMYMVDPDDLVIITDKSDPLYDPRVELPVEEPMVLNIMHKGILQNIRIVRRNNQDVVITGRQRVKAAREANKRLRKEGKEPIKVPCVLTRGDEAEQLGVMISENELRQGDGILAKAEKCKRYLDMGRTEKEAFIIFRLPNPFSIFQKKILNINIIINFCDNMKKNLRINRFRHLSLLFHKINIQL